MKNIIEYVGEWYLPSVKDKKVHGLLKIDNKNRASLEVYGLLTEVNKFQDIENVDIINGFTTNGKKITLVNNSHSNFSMSMHGGVTIKYDSRYVIIGYEYQSIEEIRLTSVKCNYTDVSKWIGISGISRRYENTKLIIEYENPENLTYRLKNYTININFDFKYSWNIYNEAIINQYTYILFDKLDEISLEETLDIVYDFSKFLTLCIGERVLPYDIELIDKEGQEINIFINGLEKKESSNKNIRDMIIPYKFMGDKFETCINTWELKKDKLEPIIDYIVESHEKVFHIPMSFIKLVQALEAFSRRMRSNCKINEEDHKQKIDYILDKIDILKYKEWLDKELEHSNEPKLQKRLQELFRELKFILPLNSKSIDTIVYNIVNTRNYYTHFDERKKDSIMNSEQVFYISKYIIIMLKVLIMIELGIEQKQISSQVEGLQDTKFIINELKKNFKIKLSN